MNNFEGFVLAERTRILPIVAACGLSGDWGDFHGPPPFNFWVDGLPPDSGRCPNCQAMRSKSESIDSGDCAIEFWLSCDLCGLVWTNGETPIV